MLARGVFEKDEDGDFVGEGRESCGVIGLENCIFWLFFFALWKARGPAALAVPGHLTLTQFINTPAVGTAKREKDHPI